jgi:VCBS repeat-containing protein
MADKVATVEGLSGKFYAKDSEGNIVELSNGDMIEAGMVVFGDESNGAEDGVDILTSDGEILKLSSVDQQLFDQTTQKSDFTEMDSAIDEQSVDKLASISDSFNNRNNDDEKEKEESGELGNVDARSGNIADVNSGLRSAGFGTGANSNDRRRRLEEDEKEKEEGGELGNADARSGNIADVNSDLRDAGFRAKSSIYERRELFEREDEGSIDAIQSANQANFSNTDNPVVIINRPTPIENPINEIEPEIIEQTPQEIPIPIAETPIYFIQISADDQKSEGSGMELTHTFTLVDENGNKVNLQVGESIDVTLVYSNISGVDGVEDSDFETMHVKYKIIGDGGSSYELKNIIADDYLAEGTEGYSVSIDSVDQVSSNSYSVDIDNTNNIAQGRIVDNSATDDASIVDSSIPDNPTNGKYDTADTVYVTIVEDTTLNEGASGTYTIKFLDKDSNPVIVTKDTDVTVTYTNITTQDVDTEYSNNDTITLTIPANTSSNTFSVATIDDYIADSGEKFNLEITDVENNGEFENIKIGDIDGNKVDVNTTINDAGAGTNKVYAVITGDESLNEAETGTYTVKLQDIDGNPIVVTQDTDVTVTYTNTTTQDGDTQYNNNHTITVTIPANNSSNTFNVDTIDDNLADNGEKFNLKITDVATTEFEPVNTKGYKDTSNNVHVNNVTTTITDNTGKPEDNSNGTPPESDSEDVVIKLVAVDSNGDAVDASGNTLADGAAYVFINEVAEGSSAYYKPLAFDSSNNTFLKGEELSEQLGSVTVSSADNNNAPVSGTDASAGSDYTAKTATTVALDTVFSIDTLDDYVADNNETFSVSIDADSYGSYAGSDVYENATEDGMVTTTIIDGADDATPNQDVDTVYLELSGDDIQGELNGEKLTHTISLVDKDGNAVNLSNGKSITVSLTYTDIAGKDAVEDADLTGGKKTTFTLTGNGGSSYSFDNIVVGGDADFELSESYNVAIGAITDQSDTGFENVAISTSQNSANGTIVEGVVVEGSNVINGTSGELIQGLGAFDTITSFTYKDENGDTQTGTVGVATNTQYGEITIESNGDWSYISDPTEDHTNGNLLDTITYTVTDGTTTTQHEFPILVTDTIPEAIDDNATTPREVVENAAAITGNVITNTDDDGADVVPADTVEVTTFTYKNTSGVDTTANAGDTVSEQNGTLTVNQDGSWSYTPNTSVDNTAGAVAANFDYTITDSDGDTSSATQYINITDSASIPTINNANNTLVKLYEGDSKVTFNGTDNYDESSSNANKDTTSTTTHKLDFSEGTDKAGITSFTFDGTTKAIAEDGSNTITDDDKGTLTVHYDGTWEYTPPASYIHPDADGINNFQETFTYTVTDIDGDAVTTGSQTIQVDDTLATFGVAPTGVSIDEQYLPSGTAPDGTQLTKTEAINIDVSKLSGAHDVTFSAVQDDATLVHADLSSLGSDISHEITNSGHTLTLKDASDNAVLTVTINNPTSDTPTYTAVLSQALDHETALLENGNLEFDFKIALNDDDKDPSNQSFKVSIIDDTSPDNQAMVVDEDSTDATITTNADVTNTNTTIFTQGTYGTASITSDGKLKYVPDANYSGEDSVTYRTTLDDGTIKDVTVAITVNPIADAPTVNVSDVSAIEDASDNTNVATGNTQEGTNSIDLSLTLPSLSDDQTDQNNTTAGDKAEKNGYIELKFTNGAGVSGAILEKADGTDLASIDSDNQTVKVYISDLGSSYHHDDLNPGADGAISLTQAEYEALRVVHAEDNDTDIDINIGVTSYEVDDSNIPLAGVTGVADSDDMTVKIRPVTDDISLIWNNATGGTISQTTNASDTFTFNTAQDEGYYFTNPLDLDALLSSTSGTDISGDLDGSEQRKYTIEDIPEGSVVTIGGQSVTADSNGTAVIRLNTANEKVSDHNDFSLKLPEEYAGIIDAKITLSVYDDGAENSDTNGELKEKVVYLKNMQVNPVADGIGTINAAQAEGLEDAGRANGNTANDPSAGDITAPENGIDLNITATTLDTSGREKVTMTIDKVPDGGALYYSDDNGIRTVDENGAVGGLTDTNANVTVSDNGDGTFKVTIVDFKNDADLKFIPPHNSNDDYQFDVSALTVDSFAGLPSSTSNTKATTIDVSVTGVADIPVHDDFKTLDSDGTDNGNAVTDIYSAVTVEDTDTDSIAPHNGAVVSFESLYAQAGLASYDSDSSETLSVVITGLGNDFSVVAQDGGELSNSGISFNGLSGASREWSFSTDDLSKVEILTSKNYSGSMEFQVKHITTENDGNSKSDTKDVKVLIKPDAEATITTSSNVTEDETSQVDFSIVQENGESGETVDVVWIKIADVTGKDFTLYTDSSATSQLTDNGGTIVTDGDYYKLTGSAINSVYIKYDLNIGSDNTTDNSFGIKYEVSDSFTANGETFTDTKTVASGVYNIPLLSITDTITLDTSETAGGASTDDIVYADGVPSVTINEVGTFSIDLDVTSTDTDNSENFTRFVIENVQRGITVDDPNAIMAISGGGTNIWFLDIPDQELTGGASSYTVNFKVNDSLRYYADTSTVKITAYAKDTGANSDDIQEAVQTIEFINNIADPTGPGVSPTIDVNLNLYDVTVTEDTQFTLDGIIETVLDSNVTNDAIADDALVTYTLAFSNLTHVSFDKANDSYTDTNVNSYGGEHYITVTARKDSIQSAIETELSKIKMIADENYNENNAGSQLSFDVKLTAYVGEGWARDTTDVKTLDLDVVPVTDDISSNVAQSHVDEDSNGVGSAQEDGTTTINITLDSVDRDALPNGNAVYTIVQGAADSTAANTIAISHTSGVYGTLSWSGGSYTFSSGNTVANVPIAEISNGNLTFSPTAHASGSANFSYTVYAQEVGAANISTTTNTFSINVAAVADGVNLPELQGKGDEDTYIQIYSDFTNQTPLDGATMIDTDDSESILSMYINDVPEDFLIYVGDDGSQKLANKGNSDGNVDLNDGNGSVSTYEWSINISDGIPKVWMKPPEDWSSTSAVNLSLKTVVKDGSDTTIVEKPFSVTVDSVADGFSSLQSNPAVQAASVDVAINLNANAGDLDGSETGILTLSGFGANDVTFKQDGTFIASAYDAGSDTYTITDIDLATDKLNELTFQKPGLQDATISYEFKTVESDDNSKVSSVESGTFSATTDNVITDITANGTDGVTDRLELSAGGISFDTISATSIEKIDLTQSGNTSITNLTMQEVLDVTDGNNELMIIADSGDSVALTNDGGNTWVQGSNITYGDQTFETYTNGDATLKVNDDATINIV